MKGLEQLLSGSFQMMNRQTNWLKRRKQGLRGFDREE